MVDFPNGDWKDSRWRLHKNLFLVQNLKELQLESGNAIAWIQDLQFYIQGLTWVQLPGRDTVGQILFWLEAALDHQLLFTTVEADLEHGVGLGEIGLVCDGKLDQQGIIHLGV